MGKTPIDCGGPSTVHSEFKDECNLPKLMRRWKRDGTLGHRLQPSSWPVADLTFGAQTFAEAARVLRDAELAFMDLDPKVRTHFHNDPERLLQALDQAGDPAVRAQLEQLGLLEPLPAPSQDAQASAKPAAGTPQPKPAEAPQPAAPAPPAEAPASS